VIFKAIRALLLVVKGPTCWEDLRTHHGQLFSTFHDAAVARSLVEGEDLWVRTVRDAMLQYRHMRQRIYWLSNFFMQIHPQDPMQLIRNNLQYLVPPRLATPSQENAAMDFILGKLEMLFRRAGLVANKEHSAGNILGLDNIFLNQNDVLTDRIRV
jgi:hypothetical protein